jgi:transcriptional pleiotropic regulator of transition state genes
MKSTGIVRKLDRLGRIVLPIELRKTLNINKKDPLEIFVDGKALYSLIMSWLAFFAQVLKIM